MNGVALDLGVIKIYWYGIFYVISFLFGGFYLYWILKKYNERYFKLKIEDYTQFCLDFLLFIILGVLVGGRLGHVFIYKFSYYWQNPVKVFYIWQGGMSFLGGLFGVTVSIFLFGKKYNFDIKDLIILGDLISLPLGFGIMLGRIGNFLNQELYGKIIDVSNTLLKVFLKKLYLIYIYSNVDSFYRINTNFIESFFEGFLFFIFINFIFWKDIKSNTYRSGKYIGIFLIRYSIVRFLIEFLRDYSQNEFIWIFTKTQWFLFLTFMIGLFFLKLFFNKR